MQRKRNRWKAWLFDLQRALGGLCSNWTRLLRGKRVGCIHQWVCVCSEWCALNAPGCGKLLLVFGFPHACIRFMCLNAWASVCWLCWRSLQTHRLPNNKQWHRFEADLGLPGLCMGQVFPSVSQTECLPLQHANTLAKGSSTKHLCHCVTY